MKEHGLQASSGVEALIDKLRERGVKAGQEEASRLVEEAEHRSDWLVSQAQQEAEQIVAKARREAEQLRRAGEEALKIAARDVHLEVRESLVHSFTGRVERLVASEMNNSDFMQRMLLELLGRTRIDMSLDQVQKVELLLPEAFIGLDELRQNPHEYKEGQLSQFVQSLVGEELKEGLSIKLHSGSGIKIKLVEEAVEVDLSDSTLAALLLKHLQPRFRAMLEGVIR